MTRPHPPRVFLYVLRTLLATLLLVSLLWALATPALADSGWAFSSFDQDVTVERDGGLRVVEQLTAQFGSQAKHGIYRDLRVTSPYDQTRDRVLRLEVDAVEMDGQPVRHDDSRIGSYEELKIGNPDRTVSGSHTYRLAYRVTGALNALSDHDELYWNATGTSWAVPIQRASTQVHAPAALQRTACYQGPAGSTDGCQAAANGASASFQTLGGLEPGQGQTVVVSLPKGAVTVPPPILEPKPKPVRRPLDEALDPGPLAKGLLVLALGIGALLVVRLVVRRDRRSAAAAVWSGETQVETSPPEGVRPAHAGLLLNRRVRPEDLPATIVDLAGRGLLSIEGGGKRAWVLRARAYDATRLTEFERILLQALFAKGSEARIWDLWRLRRALPDARRALASEAFARGWFTGRPGTTPWPWWAAAAALAVLGVVVGALVLIPVGGAIVVLGLLTPRLGRDTVRRTEEGHALHERLLALRRFVRSNTQPVLEEGSDPARVFTELLPYAVLFGRANQWGDLFGDLDLRRAGAPWFARDAGTSDAASVAHDMSSFGMAATGVMAPASGGAASGWTGASGFGGGGVGGGIGGGGVGGGVGGDGGGGVGGGGGGGW